MQKIRYFFSKFSLFFHTPLKVLIFWAKIQRTLHIIQSVKQFFASIRPQFHIVHVSSAGIITTFSYSLILLCLGWFTFFCIYRQRKFDFYLKLHSISTNWWVLSYFWNIFCCFNISDILYVYLQLEMGLKQNIRDNVTFFHILFPIWRSEL